MVYGEILNKVALGRTLGVGDQTAAGLVLSAYERWGRGLFVRLEGVHAIVVVDPRRDVTIAGVDPRSVCWLVAAEVGDAVLVTTGARALRAWPGFVTRLDQDGLADATTIGYPVWGHSLFEGVRGLQIGSHFEVGPAGLRVVRHADDRRHCGVGLRGERYLTRLVETARTVVGEAIEDAQAVLPLTGGRDSRLLAAAVPGGRRPPAVTFGAVGDDDVAAAARIAEARALEHVVVPFEQDYVPRWAQVTVVASDGCHNPVNNLTGCLLCSRRRRRSSSAGSGARSDAASSVR
jgi:asparagine synthetase B (glutamine-hydrolysing)